ncbi:hypothetical protein DN395_06445 [Bacillus sp. AR18-7]|nr:hypothetical protein DN395_06445 [Bacillus sp. AR18-7]
MRIHLYLRKYEKALGIQCFLLYTGIITVWEREYMSSNLKWIIYTVLSISILFILFVAYGVYLYFT